MEYLHYGVVSLASSAQAKLDQMPKRSWRHERGLTGTQYGNATQCGRLSDVHATRQLSLLTAAGDRT